MASSPALTGDRSSLPPEQQSAACNNHSVTESQNRRQTERNAKRQQKNYKSHQVNQILISFLYFLLNNGQCTFRSLVYFCSSSVLSSILNIFCKIYTFDICIEIYFTTVSSDILRLFSAFTERYQSRKFTYHKHFQSLHRHKGKQEAK